MLQTLIPAPSFNAYRFKTVNRNVMGVGRFIIESNLPADLDHQHSNIVLAPFSQDTDL